MMSIGDGDPKDGGKVSDFCTFGGEEEGTPLVGIILEGVRIVDRNC